MTDPPSLDYALALATKFIDDAIAAQVSLGYEAPPARVRATAIRHAEKALRPLLALRGGGA